MPTERCQHCGCTEIDIDPARGDAVCTGCGSVLQDTIIVSEVQFEDTGRGGSTALGQFVASDSKGGNTLRGSFHSGLGRESREITLRNAQANIKHLSEQLNISKVVQEISFNFFKRALQYHLTRGRRSALVIGACTYIACRTEGTAHMLLDFSDVLQVDVFELGRTYLRLAQILCINLPTLDPSVHIARFAAQMEFGDQVHQVSNTASRLVLRFKKDWIHVGRRPSGICGAALIIAGRLHGFHKALTDAVKIVKVHESTIRKRLTEFGETPSSALTLDEFMTIDLSEEQDPPSFRAARKKDKERVQKLMDDENIEMELIDLKIKIEEELEKQKKTMMKGWSKLIVPDDIVNTNDETAQVIEDSTISTIVECAELGSNGVESVIEGLGPTPESLGIGCSRVKYESNPKQEENDDGTLNLDGIDDNEIDSYLMSDIEVQYKTNLWMTLNKDYLEEMKIKEEKLAQELLEGKPEKKKRRSARRAMRNFEAKTAGEAIEKMLQEKKISSKINYDVLRSLTEELTAPKTPLPVKETESAETRQPSLFKRQNSTLPRFTSKRFQKRPLVSDSEDDVREHKVFKKEEVIETPVEEAPVEVEQTVNDEPVETVAEEVEEYEEPEDDEEEYNEEELSAAQLLSKYRGDVDDDDDYM